MVLCGHLQVGVPDIQVQSEFRQRIEQFAQLRSGVVIARQVLDHQSDAEAAGFRQQFLEGADVLLDVKAAVVHGRVPVRVQIHPAGPDDAERLETPPQLAHTGPADLFESAAHREVVRGMTDHLHSVFLEGFANGVWIDAPGRGRGRFQRQVQELHPHRRHPLDFIEDVVGRMVHGSDQH